MPNIAKLEKYLRQQAITRPLHPPETGIDGSSFDKCVIIPALAESNYLPHTLQTLARCNQDTLKQTLVVIVVNNPPPDAPCKARTDRSTDEIAQQISDNLKTLKWLNENSETSSLNLAWIDAASPGNELPYKRGVGLARKIGCDTVLSAFNQTAPSVLNDDFLFFHLDADTLTAPEYLDHATQELRQSDKGGAVIPFKHQPAADNRVQRAIDLYESYLDYYVRGLQYAGSPYAFHTMGSTIVCRASAYVKANGMPAKRTAGEDFYFLQSLQKSVGIKTLAKVMVYPSPRPSLRVPFGTGPKIMELLDQGQEITAYHPKTFQELKYTLRILTTRIRKSQIPTPDLLRNRTVRDFFTERGLQENCRKFHSQGPDTDTDQYLNAFHSWFDGFQTLRLINLLTEREWPKILLEQALRTMPPENLAQEEKQQP